MNLDILQLGAVAVIFLFAIKEFFAWLKTRNIKTNGNGWDRKAFQELKLINRNHLTDITKSMGLGNEKTIKAITDMHTDLAKLLGEIIGKLSNQ